MNRDRHDELNGLNLSEHERANMERLLAEFREASTTRAERPELFWSAMRARIGAQVREPRSYKGLGWFATLAAVTTMVVFLTVPSHTPMTGTHPTTTAVVKNTSPNDDEALLRSIAETSDSYVPDALSPATLLTSEMDRGLSTVGNQTTGRKTQ